MEVLRRRERERLGQPAARDVLAVIEAIEPPIRLRVHLEDAPKDEHERDELEVAQPVPRDEVAVEERRPQVGRALGDVGGERAALTLGDGLVDEDEAQPELDRLAQLSQAVLRREVVRPFDAALVDRAREEDHHREGFRHPAGSTGGTGKGQGGCPRV